MKRRTRRAREKVKKIVAWRKKEEGIRRRIKEDFVHVEKNEKEKEE